MENLHSESFGDLVDAFMLKLKSVHARDSGAGMHMRDCLVIMIRNQDVAVIPAPAANRDISKRIRHSISPTILSFCFIYSHQ